MKQLNAHEIHALLPEIKKGNYILVDIRSPEEWRQTGVPEEAILMSYPNIEELNTDWVMDMKNHFSLEMPLILSCRSGVRSMTAIRLLSDAGYSQLMNAEGGILAWLDAGYPIKMSSVSNVNL